MILTVTPNPAVDRVYVLEKVDYGEVNRVREATCSAGGKGINVARVAKILGEHTDAAGFAGGRNGQYICEQISLLGIGDKFTEIKGETRVCTNITQAETSTEFLEKGPFVTSGECDEFIKNFENNLDRYDVIVVSGSIPPGVPEDLYPQMICKANAEGKIIIADTSGQSLISAIKAKPFMVKPNVYELSALFKKEIKGAEDIKDVLSALKNAGIKLPVVSAGKDGCYSFLEGKVYHFVPPDVNVINPVGSGDSFVAGLAVGLMRKQSMMDTIKLAMACGTANTQFSQTGLVSAELVEKFFGEITVSMI